MYVNISLAVFNPFQNMYIIFRKSSLGSPESIPVYSAITVNSQSIYIFVKSEYHAVTIIWVDTNPARHLDERTELNFLTNSRRPRFDLPLHGLCKHVNLRKLGCFVFEFFFNCSP